MTCPALVPLALCAALGGPGDLMAASLPPSPVAASAPVVNRSILSRSVSRRRHQYYRYRRVRMPRVIVIRERPTCPAFEAPLPRPAPIEIIRTPTAIVRAGFDALRITQEKDHGDR